MSKAKVPATGEGYLGETMVHRLTHAMGVVENVVEGKAGWPPEITLSMRSTGRRRLGDQVSPGSGVCSIRTFRVSGSMMLTTSDM